MLRLLSALQIVKFALEIVLSHLENEDKSQPSFYFPTVFKFPTDKYT